MLAGAGERLRLGTQLHASGRPDLVEIIIDAGVGRIAVVGDVLEDRVLRAGEVIPLRRHARAVDPMVTRLHADRHPVGDGLTLLNDVRGVGGDGGGEAWRGRLVLVQNDHHDGLFHVRDTHDGFIPQVDVVVGVPRHDLLHGHAWIIVERRGDIVVSAAGIDVLVGLDVGIPCVLPLVLSTQFSVVALVGCRAPIPRVRVRGTDRDHTAVTITLIRMTLVEVAHALVVGGAQRIFRLGHRRQTTSVLVKSDLSRCERVLHGVDIGCRSERT